jgi:hypothetical protein
MINHTTIESSGSSVASDETARMVTFSARSVDELNRQVTGWLMEHPSMVPLSFSHAAETRHVVPYPASLSGPNRVVMYTGILLVRPNSAPVKAASS